MRHCMLMLMDHCPSRSPPSLCSRLEGGCVSSERLPAWSNIASFASARSRMSGGIFPARRPAKTLAVSLSRKLLIMAYCNAMRDNLSSGA
jgi:hypothetical protein